MSGAFVKRSKWTPRIRVILRPFAEPGIALRCRRASNRKQPDSCINAVVGDGTASTVPFSSRSSPRRISRRKWEWKSIEALRLHKTAWAVRASAFVPDDRHGTAVPPHGAAFAHGDFSLAG